MKIAAEGMPVFVYRFISAFGASIFMLIVTKATGHSLALPRRLWRPILLVAFFNGFTFLFLSALGLLILPSGHAAVMAYTMPLWAFLISIPVLHERPQAMQWIGLALGMAAIAVLLIDSLHGEDNAVTGIFVMGGAAVCWATGTIIVKKVDWQQPMSLIVTWQFLLGSLPFGLLMLKDLPGLEWPPTDVVLAVVYTVVLALGFGFWAWFKIVEMVPASVASLSVLAIPAIGVFSGSFILGETIGATEIIALTLLLSALATVILPKPK